MWAAGAEIGRAREKVGNVAQAALCALDRLQPLGDLWPVLVAEDALANGDGDLVGLERAIDREQVLALLVLLADDDGMLAVVEQQFPHMGLEQVALFLDADNEIEAAREFMHDGGIERPDEADLEEAQPDLRRHGLIDAELFQSLARIEIALADAGDADLRVRTTTEDDLVETVLLGEGDGRLALEIMEALLLVVPVVIGPDIEAARRHLEVLRNLRADAMQARFDDAGRFDRVMQAFDADPGAGETRQGPAIDRIVVKLLQSGRIEDGDHGIEQCDLALMRHGRGFSTMVIARHDDDAAMFGRARRIGMAQHVAAPVDTGSLAVPDAEDAVIGALAPHLGLLAAPDRGRGKVLVEAGMELDGFGFEQLVGPLEGLVDTANGGAAIAGDIPCGVEPRLAVERLLGECRPHHHLRPRDENPVLRQVVFVVERNWLLSHGPNCTIRASNLE